MNARAVAIQGVLALLGLVAAALTWQRRPELQADEAFILDITQNELQKVLFEDDLNQNKVELALAKDDNGSYISVLLTRGDTDKNKELTEILVRGNEAARSLFERFAPLRAVRALGVLEDAKLKDLHLDGPRKHLTITTRSGTRKFDMANPAATSNDVYLRDQVDHRVFIIARSIMVDFSNAANGLIERRLHAFRLEEADRLTVSAGPAKKELRIARGADGKGIELASMASPDRPDALARAWHDRVFAPTVSLILNNNELKAGEPVSKLRLDYASRGRSLGWLELAEAPQAAEEVSSGTPAKKTTLYARSELTTGWVKLTGDFQTLIGEGLKLAGGKP